MSMLAGPRRSQKVINLRAKNNAWSNDNEKFGQKMLEKMGWSAGKGLGAKEDGIVEHVVAKYKNDEKGFGFEDRNDQWTKHEDDFNALLGNLSKAASSDEKLHSGISLEIKSKKSKARIHYHKFTRGKDLSRYSEKDLANIFGKKSLKIEEKVKEGEIKDVKSTKQLFTEKGSMADYFKSKLSAFQTNSKMFTNNGQERSDKQMVFHFQGFSGTLNDDTDSQNTEDNHNIGFRPITTSSEEEKFDVDKQSTENIKKKKNESKQKIYPEIKEQNNHNVTESVCNKEEKKMLKRGKGPKTVEIEEKKSLNKKIINNLNEVCNQEDVKIEDNHLPKKKRKKNDKHITTSSFKSEEEKFDVDKQSIENIKKKKKASMQKIYPEIKEQNNHNVTESVYNEEEKKMLKRGKGSKTVEIEEKKTLNKKIINNLNEACNQEYVKIEDNHLPKKRKKNDKVAN